VKQDYLVKVEENEEYKYVQITPPPKDPINVKSLIPIDSLPPWARKAFGGTKHLNTI
jgi:activating signal cointegrator complex subunit 3